MRYVFGVALLLATSSTPLAAKGQGYPSVSKESLRKLIGICNDVYSNTVDRTNPEFWIYSYERKIYEAAGVEFANDTPASARYKIQALWLEGYNDGFRCDALNFQIPRGSILKYAVQMQNYSIIDNATRSWRLELNMIDPTDHETLIDFIDTKIEQNGETETAIRLRGYRETLIRAGARRTRELIPEGSGITVEAHNARLIAAHRTSAPQ